MTECGIGLVDAALVHQHDSEIGVRVGVVGLEADRRAIGGGCFLERTAVLERIAEIVMQAGTVRFERGRLTKPRDRLVEPALARSAHC